MELILRLINFIITINFVDLFYNKKIICVSNGVSKDIQKYYLFNGKKFKTI